jgi:hypothetical protein
MLNFNCGDTRLAPHPTETCHREGAPNTLFYARDQLFSLADKASATDAKRGRQIVFHGSGAQLLYHRPRNQPESGRYCQSGDHLALTECEPALVSGHRSQLRPALANTQAKKAAVMPCHRRIVIAKA